MEADPYEILGVSREAGPIEWKRAFRRLAMRWHPDRSDHPEATERFKAISAAYDRLQAVDTPEESKGDASDAATVDPAPEENVARAADIRLNLEVSLEAAAAGCRKTIHYSRGKACSTCAGSGEAGISRTRFCNACHGSGRVHDARRALVNCPECGGRGFFTERICPDCGGSGREMDDVSLAITVPPGMLPGDELRLAGQGEPGDDDLRAGDLFLTLVIRSHALYQLRGRDLCFRMPVSALVLMAGGEIELPTLKGTVSHRLEAGLPEARELRLAGQGYPGRGRNPPGDLIVQLEAVFPAGLTARQRKLLLQAEAALAENLPESLPEVAEWRKTHFPD